MIHAKFLFVPVLAVALLFSFLTVQSPVAQAASRKVLDIRVQETLEKFRTDIQGGGDILQKAKGVLVYPRIYQGGIVFGSKYGKGALLVNNKTIDYYNIIAASYGFQLGGQRRAMVLAFMTDDALNRFRNSSGWNVGADASVAVITLGAAGSIDAQTLNKPILAFVFDQKGLMYNLSLEGAKINRLK